MHNRFRKMLLLAAAAMFILLPATLRPAPSVSLPGCGQTVALASDLTVTKTSSTSADMRWTVESTSYTITVTDLATSTVVRSFTTSNRYATITGLTANNAYRFSVDSNGFVIVEDVVL